MSDRYDGDDRVDPSSVWLTSLPAWNIGFAAVLGLCAGAMFLVAPLGRALACVGLMAVLGVGYAVFGAPAARNRDAPSRWAYLSIAFGVLLLATAIEPAAGVLLFVLYPQCWLLANRERDGVLGTLGLTVAAAAGPAIGGATSLEDWRTAAPSLLVGAAFSVALGLFILRLIDQSRERAVLLGELTSAQDELAAAHHAAGVAAERERLAAEIHDTLAQGFTSIAMQAEAALARPGLDLEADRLRLIARTARDNLAEARALVAAFSPAPLEDAGLVEAVRRVAGRFQDETGIEVVVSVQGTVERLHRNHEVVLLRAVQEGLANVRKHAAAHHVTVAIVAVDDMLTAEVQDDGVGLVPRASSGFGIATMTHRVQDVGGDVDLTSSPGLGTLLRVAIPQAGGGQ